ncbi:hypothetical protein N7468_001502 [Penicillium chermesinum]|uniref:GPI anchored serine-rich protein n=1 Tax=Penicillium chermesinum TaxID=63820 RepID=A0A9W9TYQ1_9EURO|nr:uncharacterized protein N7468_001502 [Penicillium chermesinum]KAJ5246519.1 hypothetical protein N7468_001502 [Penicillium chermesinum]
MRFTAATVALFAGLAAAVPAAQDTTVYETEEVTITSCGPTVTNCPASSGAASTTPAVVATTTPAGGASWSPAPSSQLYLGSRSPAVTSSSAPAAPPAPASQSVTVIAHTTCIPTVVYSTIPLPSGTSPVTGGSPPWNLPPSLPPLFPGSASAAPSPSVPAFNGAGAVSGSLSFAGLAAAAAYFLA